MFDWLKRLVGRGEEQLPVVEVSALAQSSHFYRWLDGEKFPGGFGATNHYTPDYWTLRARSAQLFEDNLYARGLIRRLVTNEINTGLALEATPQEKLLGKPEDSLADWSEDVETRFHLWEKRPSLCHHSEQLDFGAIQRLARMEALVSGDVLAVMHQDRSTGLPRIRLVSGGAVQTPLLTPKPGLRIQHGVERDKNGRHVAYYVQQEDGSYNRLPAWGEKSGRRISWLVYGTDRRVDAVRGTPLLSIILQSLREIDRYRDSAQRKAVINSMLAMFIKKDAEKMGTRPITGGAIRKGTNAVTDATGTSRSFSAAEQIPGLVFEELQVGEEPQGFGNTGTDEKFGDFEEAMIQAVAWANEIPPEILRLAFSNNYSASQAAINEFKMYLNRVRTEFGATFCAPVYEEWLLSETIMGKIAAPELLEAWRDRSMYDIYGAWTLSDWSGHIKPSTDVYKQAKGYEILVENGWSTNDRAARELTGTKYSHNIKKLRVENALKREAREILEPPEPAVEPEPKRLKEAALADDTDEEATWNFG